MSRILTASKSRKIQCERINLKLTSMDNVCIARKQPTLIEATNMYQKFQHNRDKRSDRDRHGSDRERGDRRGQYINRQDRPKKEAILNLEKYKDSKIVVKFIGGRQIVGVLKGFDQLMNLVLDDVEETLRDPEDDSVLTENTRHFNTVVVRGPALLTISPLHGTEIIDNPFVVESQE